MIRTLVATVAVTDLRIATKAGEAMFFSESLDFSAYKGNGTTTGYYLAFKDSGGKYAYAYGYTQGAGEVLGDESFTNYNFDSGDASWTKGAGFTIVDIGGGDYQAVATAVGNNVALYQNQSTNLNSICKYVAVVSEYTSGSGYVYARNESAGTTGNLLSSTGSSVKYYTQTEATVRAGFITASANTTLNISSISRKPLTAVPSTGLNLVSARDGSTRNMESVESGFLPNSITTVYVYQISAQPPLATVAVTDLRLASLAGESMFFSESLDFSAYAGGTKLIAFKDSGNRFAYAYGGAVGGGEALGGEEITAWTNSSGNPFETFTPNANGHDIDSAINTAGDGRCYVGAKDLGSLYKLVSNSTVNSGTVAQFSYGLLVAGPNFSPGAALATLTGAKTLYRTTSPNNCPGIYAPGAVDFTSQLSFKKVTNVPATGLLLVSAYGGATRNMLSTETGFLPNSITTVYVYNVVAPSTPSPADGSTVAYTTSQALQVTNADSGACDIKFYTGAGVQIGATQSGVAAGATATVTATGLSAGLQSWYATATNTVGTVQSVTWSFTILSGVGIGMSITGHNPTITGHMGDRGFHGFNV